MKAEDYLKIKFQPFKLKYLKEAYLYNKKQCFG